MSAARALQEAVFAALVADATLEALLGGAKVFDGAPRNAAAPYVHLGEMVARDWSTATEAGTEMSFRGGRVVAGAGAVGGTGDRRARARRCCTMRRSTLDGCRLVNLRHVATETARVGEAGGAAGGGRGSGRWWRRSSPRGARAMRVGERSRGVTALHPGYSVGATPLPAPPHKGEGSASRHS